MAVDANILIFERMKEEWRKGKPHAIAMELGFGRAWDSIKDANAATILTALILINPLNSPFKLERSGQRIWCNSLDWCGFGIIYWSFGHENFCSTILKAKHD